MRRTEFPAEVVVNRAGAPQSPPSDSCEMCSIPQRSQTLVHQSDSIVVAVPLRTRVRGNLLIIPRLHVPAYDLLEETVAEELFLAAALGVRVCERCFAPDGINTWMDAGTIAGQIDGHIAIEIVPRFADVRYEFITRVNLPESELTQVERVADVMRKMWQSFKP